MPSVKGGLDAWFLGMQEIVDYNLEGLDELNPLWPCYTSQKRDESQHSYLSLKTWDLFNTMKIS